MTRASFFIFKEFWKPLPTFVMIVLFIDYVLERNMII